MVVAPLRFRRGDNCVYNCEIAINRQPPGALYYTITNTINSIGTLAKTHSVVYSGIINRWLRLNTLIQLRIAC